MSKVGVVKVCLVAEVKDAERVKEKLPAMIDNCRKHPGVVNVDFCEMVGDNTKYAIFGVFENEDAYNKFHDSDRMKEIREKGKENYKGEWTAKKFKVLY